MQLKNHSLCFPLLLIMSCLVHDSSFLIEAVCLNSISGRDLKRRAILFKEEIKGFCLFLNWRYFLTRAASLSSLLDSEKRVHPGTSEGVWMSLEFSQPCETGRFNLRDEGKGVSRKLTPLGSIWLSWAKLGKRTGTGGVRLLCVGVHLGVFAPLLMWWEKVPQQLEFCLEWWNLKSLEGGSLKATKMCSLTGKKKFKLSLCLAHKEGLVLQSQEENVKYRPTSEILQVWLQTTTTKQVAIFLLVKERSCLQFVEHSIQQGVPVLYGFEGS